MIHPRLDPPPPWLQKAWQESGNVRVEGFLREGLAEEILAELRTLPHQLSVPAAPTLQYLMASYEAYPDDTCDHALCRFVAWWLDAGRAWVEAVIGEPVVAPPENALRATLYTKGCYLDAHNDKADTRMIAFVVGFTDATWPHEDGGWLEFLEFEGGHSRVVERRPPGFDTLDLFDVRRGLIHEIPILHRHHERRVVNSWFHRPPDDSGSD